MYKIARYLTLEQRRAAASREYRPMRWSDTGVEISSVYPNPVCADGMCPLGVALEPKMLAIDRRPDADAVATLIAAPYDYLDIYKAADKFIADWDTGKIKDIAKAMGVKGSKR